MMTSSEISLNSEMDRESLAAPSCDSIILKSKDCDGFTRYFQAQKYFIENDYWSFFCIRLKVIDPVNKYSEYQTTRNAFQASVDKYNGRIKLGPNSHLIMAKEFRSLRLGSYLFAHVIKYIKDNYPDFPVDEEDLSSISPDGDIDNFIRRHHFYKKFNFKIRYKYDSEGNNTREGKFYADTAGDLNVNLPGNGEKNERGVSLRELSKEEIIREFIHDKINALSLENVLNNYIDENHLLYRSYFSPIQKTHINLLKDNWKLLLIFIFGIAYLFLK